MVTPRTSRHRIPRLASILIATGLITMASSAVAQTPAGDCGDAVITLGASTRDRVVHQQDGRSLMIEVSRLTGIGRLKLQPSGPGCLSSVVIRLRDFQELEGLRVRTPNVAMACDQLRMEGKRPRFSCRLGPIEIDAVVRKPDSVEVTLPPQLLENGEPVEIHWIDQWR